MYTMLYMEAGEKHVSYNRENEINTKINCKEKYTNDRIRKINCSNSNNKQRIHNWNTSEC